MIGSVPPVADGPIERSTRTVMTLNFRCYLLLVGYVGTLLRLGQIAWTHTPLPSYWRILVCFANEWL